MYTIRCAGGVAFVMAAAGTSLAETQLLYQIVEAYKRASYLVIVCVTRPFAFENGSKRQALADSMIGSLRENAHPVVAIEQDVLLKHDPDISMPQAQQVADTAMLLSVKNLLLAMNCPEVIKSNGALLHHVTCDFVLADASIMSTRFL